jgi:hypothetical protein
MDSLRFAPARFGRGRLVRNNDRSIVLQLIEAAVGDNVSWVDAFNLCYTAVGDPRRYAAHVSEIILNQIDKRRLPVLLNG